MLSRLYYNPDLLLSNVSITQYTPPLNKIIHPLETTDFQSRNIQCNDRANMLFNEIQQKIQSIIYYDYLQYD